MIRAVCTSDREFRDGYNEVMKSPMYDDQLLQQESSLDLDEIQKYNDAKKKEREEIERKKREKEEAEKPRYCMWKTFFLLPGAVELKFMKIIHLFWYMKYSWCESMCANCVMTMKLRPL